MISLPTWAAFTLLAIFAYLELAVILALQSKSYDNSITWPQAFKMGIAWLPIMIWFAYVEGWKPYTEARAYRNNLKKYKKEP